MFRLEKTRVGFFHHDDARVAAQFPRELALADIYGENFCRAALEQTIRETAGGRADVNGGESGDVELKMFQRVFELVAAARNEFFRRIHNDFIGGFDGVAGFFRRMAVDSDDAGEDEALGFFAAVAECAFDERLIESRHGQNLVPLVKTRFWTSRKLCRNVLLSATAFSTSCFIRNNSELLMTA